MGLIEKIEVISNRVGWPWTEETDPQIYQIYKDYEWPKISIITPSFNQGIFIEETIRSVILQNYPNLEYIIIDGGSKDQTVEVVKKYEPWLTYWVSELDEGQTDAINKGLSISTGEVINWINSDDILAAKALFNIGSYFIEKDFDILIGASETISINEAGDVSDKTVIWIPKKNILPLNFINQSMVDFGMAQPSIYIRRIFLNRNNIDIKPYLHFSFDWRLYLECLLCDPKISFCDSKLSVAKLHPEAKTFKAWENFIKEGIITINELLNEKPLSATIIKSLKKKKASNEKWLLFNGFLKKEPNVLGSLKFIQKHPSMLLYRPFIGTLRRLFFRF